MANVFKNLKTMFSDTRSRVIFLLTFAFLAIVVVGSLYAFYQKTGKSMARANVAGSPSGLRSIPGSVDQTKQYAELQQEQNAQQAEAARKTGKSAIPTLIDSQEFSEGQSLAAVYGNCNKEVIELAIAQGGILADIMEACSCQDLKSAGFELLQLKDMGYTAAQLRDCGYSAQELKDAGFSAAELKEAGFSAKELKDAGFSAKELKDAGFTAKELKDAGFTAKELKDAGFSAKELKDAGFSAKELKDAGFTAAELKAAGFTAAELLAAGFTPEELLAAGFSLQDLLDAGLSMDELCNELTNIDGIDCDPDELEKLENKDRSAREQSEATAAKAEPEPVLSSATA
ncbi:MAG: pentapeptide repeat-containing protein, partial [Gammaproteobacteria bacterium]